MDTNDTTSACGFEWVWGGSQDDPGAGAPALDYAIELDAVRYAPTVAVQSWNRVIIHPSHTAGTTVLSRRLPFHGFHYVQTTVRMRNFGTVRLAFLHLTDDDAAVHKHCSLGELEIDPFNCKGLVFAGVQILDPQFGLRPIDMWLSQSSRVELRSPAAGCKPVPSQVDGVSPAKHAFLHVGLLLHCDPLTKHISLRIFTHSTDQEQWPALGSRSQLQLTELRLRAPSTAAPGTACHPVVRLRDLLGHRNISDSWRSKPALDTSTAWWLQKLSGRATALAPSRNCDK